MWGCGGKRGTDPQSVVPTPKDIAVTVPWHITNIYLHTENEPTDIASYCATFTIEGRVPDGLNLYIAPFSGRINHMLAYGGIQTKIDGATDKNSLASTYTTRSRGAIFSRWEERNVEAARQVPGGLVASLGNEGNFISVRNDFAWSEGTYRLCLRTSDVVAGEPLPVNYKPEDVAYGWGHYEHVWVRMEATDMTTNKTTTIGELAFPGKTISLSTPNIMFVEIYGQGGTHYFVKDFPLITLSFFHFEVDEKSLDYVCIEEIVNPNPVHASAPVIAQTSYLQDQGIIKIELGKPIEKLGKIVTQLLKK